MSSAVENKDLKIGIIEIGDLFKDMPRFFTMAQGNRINYDSKKAVVFSDMDDEVFLDAHPTLYHIDTLGEYETFQRRLLALPIFMTVHLGFQGQSSEDRKSSSYVICVNPRHPECAHLLKPSVQMAEGFLRRGKRFCLEVDFTPAILKWFKKFKAGFHRSEFYALGGKFYITNFSKPRDFEGGSAFTKIMSTVLVKPGYSMYRFLACNDIQLQVCLNIVTHLKPTQKSEVAPTREATLPPPPPYSPNYAETSMPGVVSENVYSEMEL